MDERASKRDLVLAPGEYAYMQDVTKGVVKTYTGPTVINPTAQERPIVFDARVKRFEPCALEDAVQRAAIAPEGYYLVLKNPSMRGDHPPAGGVHPSPDLAVGRKINVTGPCQMALWPGQMVKLVPGHHLRSNQYLLVRVYNEEEARRSWSEAVIKPATTEPGGAEAPPAPLPAPSDLVVGKLLVIKGVDVSFYIPPTGVGVVPDESGRYVREALTLERLEYAILVDQNGKKRYERGPKVVFPEPTETFLSRDEQRKFRAIELAETQGLHIKVIAPYDEGAASFREGDELFLTGRQTAIYYPREEHSLVRYDGKDKHYAVAIPAGEARYVMNRRTGDIRMVLGPAMLLPNPIEEVLVRRVLSDKECATFYPGNAGVLAYNRSLREVSVATPTTRPGAVVESDWERSRRAGGPPDGGPSRAELAGRSSATAGDVLDRGSGFVPPRTITRATAEAHAATLRRQAELDALVAQSRLEPTLATIAADIREHEERRLAAVARNAALDIDHDAGLARERQTAELATRVLRDREAVRIEALRADVEAAVQRFGAAQDGFAEALLALSNREVLVKVAEAMSVQSFVGGKSLADVVDRVFAGTPLQGLLERVEGRAAGNGAAPPAAAGRGAR